MLVLVFRWTRFVVNLCVCFFCNPESEKQPECSSNRPCAIGQFPLQSKQAASAEKTPFTGVVVRVLVPSSVHVDGIELLSRLQYLCKSVCIWVCKCFSFTLTVDLLILQNHYLQCVCVCVCPTDFCDLNVLRSAGQLTLWPFHRFLSLIHSYS